MLDRFPFHDMLEARRPAMGLILNFAAPPLVEIASLMGFDFVLIDAEHGPIDAANAEPIIRVAELTRIAPLVRVPSLAPDIVLRFLDIGAVGIVFPHIKSAEEVRAAIETLRFPPSGRRGLSLSTSASGYGVRMPQRDFIEHSNRLLLPMIIVEEPEAVESIEAIARVEGVAAIVVGQGDLAAAMGFPGDPTAPEVAAAIEHIIRVCRSLEMPFCLLGTNTETARRSIERGATMVITPFGNWIANYGRTFVDEVRGGQN
jgi:2-keto-3-deoxy-L-rhamnonate aldolase RhmA